MATFAPDPTSEDHSASSVASSTETPGQSVIAQSSPEVENAQASAIPASPTTDAARRWNHDVRNAFNTVRLCTFAFEVCDGLFEQLEMLDQIDRAADWCDRLMDGPPGELSH